MAAARAAGRAAAWMGSGEHAAAPAGSVAQLAELAEWAMTLGLGLG